MIDLGDLAVVFFAGTTIALMASLIRSIFGPDS